MKLKDKMAEMAKAQVRVNEKQKNLDKISEGIDKQCEKLNSVIRDALQKYRGTGTYIDVKCEKYFGDAGILRIIVEKCHSGQYKYYSLEIRISFHKHGLTDIWLADVKDGMPLGEITNLVAAVEKTVANYELK